MRNPLAADYTAVSIHAPTGERPRIYARFCDAACFNPRSHMGSDVQRLLVMLFPLTVSIHAPTWGATAADRLCIILRTFQSTLPHGERLLVELDRQVGERVSIHAPTWGATSIVESPPLLAVFQSTLPHGERLRQVQDRSDQLCFNPRSHMGSDLTAPLFCGAA